MRLSGIDFYPYSSTSINVRDFVVKLFLTVEKTFYPFCSLFSCQFPEMLTRYYLLFFQTQLGFRSTFVSGAYVAYEHTFTCLNYLRNVRESVTETIGDVDDFSLIDDEMFYKYLSTLKNVSLLNLMPTFNVALPSLPDLGWDQSIFYVLSLHFQFIIQWAISTKNSIRSVLYNIEK